MEFTLSQVKRNKELIAVEVVAKPQTQQAITKNGVNGTGNTVCQGFIAALKDGFGFIETVAHDREVFFRFRYLKLAVYFTF